jgi:hypothetical protein
MFLLFALFLQSVTSDEDAYSALMLAERATSVHLRISLAMTF